MSTSEKTIYRKPYVQNQSASWWLKNKFYIWYMVREGTAIFVFLYALILMLGLLRLAQGEAAWNAWVASLSNPAYIVFHGIALIAAMYHVHTFFKMFPKVIVIRFGNWKMPESYLIAGQWVGFVVCTAVILGIGLFVGV